MIQIATEEFSEDLRRHLAVYATKEDGSFSVKTLIGDADFVRSIETALETLDASGVVRLINPADSSKLVFVVVGEEETTVRDAFGDLARTAAGLDELVVASEVSDVAGAVEGALTGGYVFDEYKKPKKAPLGTLVLLIDDADAISRGQIIAERINHTRNLVNRAPSELVPEDLARIAEEEGTAAGLTVTVYREEELEKMGAVGLLQVGRGSAHPPRLVRLQWDPADADGQTTALVGKGITFDTGGYSLKPANVMTEMKTDMAGAATVLNTLIAAARLNVRRKAVGWLCIAENMVSGTAGLPDDVIVYRNGTSVEIDNTDAEGRLVLADGLICASEEKSEKIIDIATLTGAQMVALGERVTGIMGTDEYAATLADIATGVGEDAWHMPLPDHLRETLDSDVANIKNAGSRYGGMLTAGLFLKEFVDAKHWAHLDIAGPSFNRSKPRGATPKGATGVMLRTMLASLEQDAQ